VGSGVSVSGGLRAEWLVGCDWCAVDAEPGRFYDTQSEAESVRHRAVKQQGWVISERGELVCPACVEQTSRPL
jgi:hypothetical protein